MSEKFPDTPLMGDMVFYFDEDKRPYAAVVAYVHKRAVKGTRRPVCNLATYKHDGRVANRVDVEPAYFDNHTGIWRIIGKWSWPDEVPEEFFTKSPSSEMRRRRVGLGESLVP